MTEVTTRGPGRLPGSTIKRLSAVIRARYGLHNDLPLDVLLATMEYWAAQCAKLVDREAEAATTVDAATGKVIRAEPDTKLAADIRYAFEMLGWYSEKCAPYFHPKVKPVELGGTIDLRRLSYDDLQILVPLLRKARALTIEDRSESSTDVSADGSTEDNGGDRQQQAGGGRSSRR